MGLISFIKHVYGYFSSEEVLKTIVNDDYILVYSTTGQVIQYSERAAKAEKQKGNGLTIMAPKHVEDISKGPADVPTLYTLTPDGQYVPYVSLNPPKHPDPSPNMKSPQPQQPLQPQQPPQPQQPSKYLQPESQPLKQVLDSDTWDGWPDGFIDQDFTFKQRDETNNFQAHWAMEGSGGRTGSSHAKDWQGGQKASHKCLGIIKCKNPTCQIIICPHTKGPGIASQLEKLCICGAELDHHECGIRIYLWTWAGGVHYSHQGYHAHECPTHILHLLPKEKHRFEELVKAHLNSGPLQLVVGVPGIHGPGESAADISSVLLNAHWVGKKRQKVKQGENLQTIDALIAAFSKFETDHPGFVLQLTFGSITVVSLQTEFMHTQMVKDEPLDSPINGLVNDAAHASWWTEWNSLLMVSSTYCPVLFCGVPGVLSYTNGASADHFHLHFYAVMLSIS